MSTKKARPATVENLISALMERLSEYESYFGCTSGNGEKPDNQAVTAYHHLAALIHKIEYDNDMGGAGDAKRASEADTAASTAEVLGDVYGIRFAPEGAPEARDVKNDNAEAGRE